MTAPSRERLELRAYIDQQRAEVGLLPKFATWSKWLAVRNLRRRAVEPTPIYDQLRRERGAA